MGWLVAPHMPPAGDLAGNSGVYPDRESNQQPLRVRKGAQSTEPHQPGLFYSIFQNNWKKWHLVMAQVTAVELKIQLISGTDCVFSFKDTFSHEKGINDNGKNTIKNTLF